MVDKIFRMLSSAFIAFVAGVLCFVPSLYIAFKISNLSKDHLHAVMPTGPVFAATLIATIVFLFTFYLAFKNNEKIISRVKYIVHKK